MVNAEKAYLRVKEAAEFYNDAITACEGEPGCILKLRDIDAKVNELISSIKRVNRVDVHQSNAEIEEVDTQGNGQGTVAHQINSRAENDVDEGAQDTSDVDVFAIAKEYADEGGKDGGKEGDPHLQDGQQANEEAETMDGQQSGGEIVALEIGLHCQDFAEPKDIDNEQERNVNLIHLGTASNNEGELHPLLTCPEQESANKLIAETDRADTPVDDTATTLNYTPPKSRSTTTLELAAVTNHTKGRRTPTKRISKPSRSLKSPYQQRVMPIAAKLKPVENKVWDWLLNGGTDSG